MRPSVLVSLRLVLALATAGLASGITLVAVYLWAQPRIEANNARALAEAIYRVLPGSETSSTWMLSDGAWSKLEGSGPGEGEPVYAGYDAEGNLVGFAIPAEGTGYMDTIRLLYGLVPDRGTIVGMEVLESRETPGLGDKILTDAAFLANFVALEAEPSIVAVKKGKKTRPNEVDGITGATISSESVVKILDRSASRWLPLLRASARSEEMEIHGTVVDRP